MSQLPHPHQILSPSLSPMILLRVQFSLIIGQIFFGLGSVIAFLGLQQSECCSNPFVFAFYRQLFAGLILSILSASSQLLLFVDDNDNKTITTIFSSSHDNFQRFVLLGLTIYGNQGCVFAGIKLVGPVVAAIWQPSQPIITAAISMLFQWEPLNKIRIVGVILAFFGCTCMILLGEGEESTRDDDDDDDDSVSSSRTTILQKMVVGHCLFFINCLCASLYVILSKKPLRNYPSLTVVAWSYNFAAIFMAITAWLISLSSTTMELFCAQGDDEQCDNSNSSTFSWWKLPKETILPLLYFIIFNSVIAHAIITWANQYATSTLIMGFTVLQPTTAAFVTVALLSMGYYPNRQNQQTTESSSQNHTPCLEGLGWNSILGMVGVISGLALVIVTEPTTDETDEKNDDDEHTTTKMMVDDEEPVSYKQMT